MLKPAIVPAWAPHPTLPDARLYCLPHAGGSGLPYLLWRPTLDRTMRVQLMLWKRGVYASLAQLLDALLDQLASDVPFALFGHSFGALLAFELARICHRRRLPLPQHIFVSGCPAPSHMTLLTDALSDDDMALQNLLCTLAGPDAANTPYEQLASVRADLALLATYQFEPDIPFHVPMTVLTGDCDPWVRLEDAAAWQAQTSASWHLVRFAGGHFFLHQHSTKVTELIRSRWRPMVIAA